MILTTGDPLPSHRPKALLIASAIAIAATGCDAPADPDVITVSDSAGTRIVTYASLDDEAFPAIEFEPGVDTIGAMDGPSSPSLISSAGTGCSRPSSSRRAMPPEGPVTDRDITEFREASLRRAAGPEARMRRALDEVPYPSVVPSLRAMAVDEEAGMVWLTGFTTGEQPAPWYLFDPLGCPIGQVTVPGGNPPLDRGGSAASACPR